MISAPHLEGQWPGIVFGKLMFSAIILKTKLVASKHVTANNYFLFFSEGFFGELNENLLCIFLPFTLQDLSEFCFYLFTKCTCVFSD